MISILTFALSTLLATTPAFAQGDLTEANNVTHLEGTWTSNSAVSTGGVSSILMPKLHKGPSAFGRREGCKRWSRTLG